MDSQSGKQTSWRNGSASVSRSEGCVFISRRGQEAWALPFRLTNRVNAYRAMTIFGLVNLMPLLNFERLWWNINSAETTPFLIFPVGETRAAVVSRNAKAGT